MSGISGASASGSSASSSTVGTDLAPITFPGIASGIDYNSIINKLTSLTLAPNTGYENQITQLNAKNAELIKINGLFASVQNALSALSDPATFNSYVGSSSDPYDANVTQQSTGNPTPGTYTIESTKTATATQVTSGSSAGVTLNLNTALISAGAAITPTNGSNGQAGVFTVDGVSINYDVNSESLNTIVNNIYTSVHAIDAGFSISVASSGEISLSSTDEAISLGSSADNGNLEQVLKLDTAEINGSGPPYGITSSGPIGGINPDTTLSAANNAGFATAVTSGIFTINGVGISVNAADDNVTSILAKINASTAGVVAAYDLTDDTFSITNKATGAQSIVVASSKDTSNFLSAASLTISSGASTTVGQRAYVTILSNSGALQTVYSDSNAVSDAIPGMAINLTGSTSTPFTITVGQNANLAINAINTFVSVYNAALSEIAIATAPPVVQQTTSTATSTTSSSTQLSQGGVLYGDESIQTISSELTQIVTGLSYNGSTTYNSLDSIGLSLDTSHTVYQSNTNAYGGTVDSTTSGPIATTTADGTDGQFQQLDATTFSAAFAADPSAVEALFTSSSASASTTLGANVSFGSSSLPSGLSYQLGAYLTGVTGNPTSLTSGLVGTIPAVAVLQGDENAATAEITGLNQSIKTVTDKANAQANLLRAQATASEALISQYQSEQSAVNQLNSSSSSSS